ncbi:type VII secretion target [Amycolatopsis aidingensis]|uniref:type VII secretion target n=1 Tax=Amycolatopsis aidingensis TaxID=2842453 RepID=UPI001C0C7416|nr:type VII secretion target [Amycolatopsis aidingensis]
MSGGFTVSEDELRTYAQKLTGQKGTAGEIAGLVDTADVGDESWGIVGIFVKGQYTEMLGELKDLFTDLQNGLQNGADKFSQAADGYQQHEEAVAQLLDGLKVQIDN